jgi:hypothetical protein
MRFAIRLTGFCRELPETWEGRHVRDQLFRGGTGVASSNLRRPPAATIINKSAIRILQFLNQRNPSMISSSASGPGRTSLSGSVASGSSTRFSWVRKSSRSGSM